MNCTVATLESLDQIDLAFIRDNLTRDGSDFQAKLRDGRSDGFIAIVREHGEIIGWCRTERWLEERRMAEWGTLESFVAMSHRHRGVASFAACGLRTVLSAASLVAVFHPHMLLVARRASLSPVLFAKENDAWSRVQ